MYFLPLTFYIGEFSLRLLWKGDLFAPDGEKSLSVMLHISYVRIITNPPRPQLTDDLSFLLMFRGAKTMKV